MSTELEQQNLLETLTDIAMSSVLSLETLTKKSTLTSTLLTQKTASLASLQTKIHSLQHDNDSLALEVKSLKTNRLNSLLLSLPSEINLRHSESKLSAEVTSLKALLASAVHKEVLQANFARQVERKMEGEVGKRKGVERKLRGFVSDVQKGKVLNAAVSAGGQQQRGQSLEKEVRDGKEIKELRVRCIELEAKVRQLTSNPSKGKGKKSQVFQFHSDDDDDDDDSDELEIEVRDADSDSGEMEDNDGGWGGFGKVAKSGKKNGLLGAAAKKRKA